MGTMTTMRELADFWEEMTAEERLGYRVRFGDDVFEVISIEATDDDQATIRGYQLNGPLAQEQRDPNSRAARVKMVPMTQGAVEILDHDEPVENDDPGPPPVLRLADYADTDDSNPEPWPVKNPADTPPFTGAPNETVAVDRSTVLPADPPSSRIAPSGASTWISTSGFAPQPPSSVLDTPVDSWASTAVRLPHEILDRGQKEARRRGISRNILFAHLLDQGLNDLEGRPLV